jgi:TolA-binding protein
MFYKVKTASIILSVFLLSACGESISKIRLDVNKLNQSLSDLRNYQAEQTTQIEALRGEVRDLTGRLDVIEHSQSTKIGSDISSLKDDLTTLKKRVPPPAIVPVGAFEEDEIISSSMPLEVGKLYDDAFLRLREGNFQMAVPALRSALDSSAGTEWVPTLLLWLGVAFDGLNDNRNALASYNEIVTRYPKHKRASLALSRQASVFLRLGDKSTAKLTLKKLISDYPKSSESFDAKERLKNF